MSVIESKLSRVARAVCIGSKAGIGASAMQDRIWSKDKLMERASGLTWNRAFGATIALVFGPSSLFLYDPPRSYLLACAALCFGWYEAFCLLPNVKSSASFTDIYRAFRAMTARDNGFGSRVVGLLGVVLVVAAIFVRT